MEEKETLNNITFYPKGSILKEYIPSNILNVKKNISHKQLMLYVELAGEVLEWDDDCIGSLKGLLTYLMDNIDISKLNARYKNE